MWLFTQTGFVSAVQHRAEPDTIVVRARDRESPTNLVASTGGEVEKSPTNDYPYRVHVSRNDFSKWLTQVVATIDYSNFKNKVKESRGYHFASTLMGAWEIMHEVEDDGARS